MSAVRSRQHPPNPSTNFLDRTCSSRGSCAEVVPSPPARPPSEPAAERPHDCDVDGRGGRRRPAARSWRRPCSGSGCGWPPGSNTHLGGAVVSGDLLTLVAEKVLAIFQTD